MNDSQPAAVEPHSELEALRARVAELERKHQGHMQTAEGQRTADHAKSAILDSMSELVVHQDLEHRIIWGNQAAGDSVGLTVDEMIGRQCHEVWHQRAEPCPDCPVVRAGKTGRTEEGEVRSPDGRMWFIRACPIRNADGRVVSVIEVTLDITDHRDALEALRLAERDKSAILDAMSAHVVYQDLEHRVLWANRAAGESVGLVAEELAGRRCYEVWPQRTEPCPGCPVAKARETAQVQEAEMTTPDGRIWLVRGRPILEANGQVVNVVEVTLEVTAQKQAERALRLTRFAMDHAANTVVWMGEDARFVYVNEAACRSLGYSHAELLSMTVHDVDPDFPREVWADHWRDLKERRSLTFESRHRAKDGRIFPVEIVANLLEFEGTEYNCAFARDISEREQAEEERQRLEDRLRHAQKMEAVGTFAAGVAHDFNNILTAIQGFATLAQKSVSKNDRAYEALEEIDHAVQHATSVTNSLLTFSQRDSSEKCPLRVSRIITESLRMLRRIMPAAIEIVPDMPSSLEVWVHGNESQLQQVLMNLAVNARDAMPQGGRLGISLRHEVSGSSALRPGSPSFDRGAAIIVVEDTGIGMPDEVRARVFEPFFTTKARGRGTGLGMAVVHGIVMEHGGRIEVESREGHGSRVTVEFPCGDPPGTAPAPSPSQTGKEGRGETVLIVEDSRQVRAIMATALESAGYQVIEAADGREGVEVFKAHQSTVRVAILDIDLPKLSGGACLGKIRQSQPDLPAIMISGLRDVDLPGERPDNVLVLRKPFAMARLVASVAETLTESRDSEG